MARTMTVALGPHYEEFIKSAIVSGRYNNASEVVRTALRRLEDEESKLTTLRAAIDEGDASGDVVGFDRNAFLSDLKAQSR